VKFRDRKAPHIHLTEEERLRSGFYYARLQYDRECAPAWEFERVASGMAEAGRV